MRNHGHYAYLQSQNYYLNDIWSPLTACFVSFVSYFFARLVKRTSKNKQFHFPCSTSFNNVYNLRRQNVYGATVTIWTNEVLIKTLLVLQAIPLNDITVNYVTGIRVAVTPKKMVANLVRPGTTHHSSGWSSFFYEIWKSCWPSLSWSLLVMWYRLVMCLFCPWYKYQ